MTVLRLTRDPVDVGRLLPLVAGPERGATALFVGTVRDHNEGRAVTGIDYSAYEAMAVRELERIAAEAEGRYGVAVAVEHRLGTLGVGDASVAIAVAHARRGAAMDGLRYVVEELKLRVPIWKREHYADGTRGWVAAGGSAPAAEGTDGMVGREAEVP